jgi:hypothetical protein
MLNRKTKKIAQKAKVNLDIISHDIGATDSNGEVIDQLKLCLSVAAMLLCDLGMSEEDVLKEIDFTNILSRDSGHA